MVQRHKVSELVLFFENGKTTKYCGHRGIRNRHRTIDQLPAYDALKLVRRRSKQMQSWFCQFWVLKYNIVVDCWV